MTNGPLERRFATSFRGTDDSAPGLILKDDGTVWLVNPDGSETQLPGTGNTFDGGIIHHTLTVDPTGSDEPSVKIGESTEPPNDGTHAQLYADPMDGLLKVKLPDNSVVVIGPSAAPPLWTDISDTISISNGTVNAGLSYAFVLTQAADPAGALPSVTALWVRVIYASYTGGGEPGTISLNLPLGTAATDVSDHSVTCEIAGYWATGGQGSWDTFGSAYWSSVDANVNVAGSPTFADGEILLCGMGMFPSF